MRCFRWCICSRLACTSCTVASAQAVADSYIFMVLFAKALVPQIIGPSSLKTLRRPLERPNRQTSLYQSWRDQHVSASWTLNVTKLEHRSSFCGTPQKWTDVGESNTQAPVGSPAPTILSKRFLPKLQDSGRQRHMGWVSVGPSKYHRNGFQVRNCSLYLYFVLCIHNFCRCALLMSHVLVWNNLHLIKCAGAGMQGTMTLSLEDHWVQLKIW